MGGGQQKLQDSGERLFFMQISMDIIVVISHNYPAFT